MSATRCPLPAFPFRSMAPSATGPMLHRAGVLLAVLLALLLLSGCASLAEHEAEVVAEKELAVGQDIHLIRGDLALFRQCFSHRGGSCPASDSSSTLPHSNPSSSTATPAHGSSELLATAVSNLQDGHPAQEAYSALGHSVTRRVSGLHHHLRGHEDSADGTAGLRISTDSKGRHVVHFDLGHHELRDFVQLLFGSIGGGGFHRLQELCTALQNHEKAQNAKASEQRALAADCRRVAFVREYLADYFRHGHIVGADVDTTGLVSDVESVDQRIDSAISSFQTSAQQRVQSLATQLETQIGQKLDSHAQRIDTQIQSADPQAPPIAGNLSDAIKNEVTQVVSTEVTAFGQGLGELASAVQQPIDSTAQSLESDVQQETAKANQALSKVFRVSNTGFVSRDTTWQAKVPSFEITLDPTATHLLTVTDQQTGQEITQSTNFSHLGVDANGSGADLGSQMVRVFLEALFDAHEGLPALGPANGPAASGLDLGPWSLPAFGPPMGNVSEDDWNAMVTFNGQVAVNVEAVLTRVVEGLGPVSLNNQALEQILVEIFTTTTRKISEKASWCWYACNLDQAVHQAHLDVDALLQAKENEAATAIRTGLDDVGKDVAKAETDVAHHVGSYAHHVAHEVALRLHLHKDKPTSASAGTSGGSSGSTNGSGSGSSSGNGGGS